MKKAKVGENFVEKYQMYLLLAIIIFSAFMALVFLKGVSVYGDDVSYISLVPQIISGTFRESADIFSIRLLMIVPLALSTYLLGYNNYGAGLYSILCYIGSVAITFFIGRKAYNPRPGCSLPFFFLSILCL